MAKLLRGCSLTVIKSLRPMSKCVTQWRYSCFLRIFCVKDEMQQPAIYSGKVKEVETNK